MSNPGWGTSFTSPLGFMVRHNRRMVHTWSGNGDSRNVDNGNTTINYDDGLGNGLLDPDQYFLLGALVDDYDTPDDSGLVPYAVRFNVFNPAAQPVDPVGDV